MGQQFLARRQPLQNIVKKRGKREVLTFGKPINGFIDAVAMKQKSSGAFIQYLEHFINEQAPLTHHWLESANPICLECIADAREQTK